VREKLCSASPTGSLDIPLISCTTTWGTGNEQTDRLLALLGLHHIWTQPHVPGMPSEATASASADSHRHEDGSSLLQPPPPPIPPPMPMPPPPSTELPLPDDYILSFSHDLQQKRENLDVQSKVDTSTVIDFESDDILPNASVGISTSMLKLPPPKFG
jgi:hypothetical protein